MVALSCNKGVVGNDACSCSRAGLAFVKQNPWFRNVVIQLQGVRRGRSIFAPCVLRPLHLVIMYLSIGGKVFYTRSTGLRVTLKVVPIRTIGMWS